MPCPYALICTLHTDNVKSLDTLARTVQSATDCGGTLMVTMKEVNDPAGATVQLFCAPLPILTNGYSTHHIADMRCEIRYMSRSLFRDMRCKMRYEMQDTIYESFIT